MTAEPHQQHPDPPFLAGVGHQGLQQVTAAYGSRSIAMLRAADSPPVTTMLAAAYGSRSIAMLAAADGPRVTAMLRAADGPRVTAVFVAEFVGAALTMPAQRRKRHMTLGDGAVGGAQPYDVAGQSGLRGPVPVGEPAQPAR